MHYALHLLACRQEYDGLGLEMGLDKPPHHIHLVLQTNHSIRLHQVQILADTTEKASQHHYRLKINHLLQLQRCGRGSLRVHCQVLGV